MWEAVIRDESVGVMSAIVTRSIGGIEVVVRELVAPAFLYCWDSSVCVVSQAASRFGENPYAPVEISSLLVLG